MNIVDQSSLGLILLSTITTSFFGSTHCMGMCGGIVFIVNDSISTTLLYHIGRLISYLSLTAIITLVGQTLLPSMNSNILALMAPISIGIIFISMGIIILRGRTLHIKLPHFTTLLLKKSVSSNKESKNTRALVIGLTSVFLPCGWLYGFVFGAAATQDLKISIFMIFTFWLGTLPLLTLAPNIIQKILAPLKRKSPKFASLILIAAGTYTIVVAIQRVL